MKKLLILGLAVATVGLFAACSSGGKSGERYPQWFENNVIAGCAASFSDDPDFSNFCHCYLNELEAHLTFEEVVALGEDMASDPDYVPQVVEDATLACADELPAGWQAPTSQDAPEF